MESWMGVRLPGNLESCGRGGSEKATLPLDSKVLDSQSPAQPDGCPPRNKNRVLPMSLVKLPVDLSGSWYRLGIRHFLRGTREAPSLITTRAELADWFRGWTRAYNMTWGNVLADFSIDNSNDVLNALRKHRAAAGHSFIRKERELTKGARPT